MSSRIQSGARCPLLLGALAFSAGILGGQRVCRPASWWLAGAIAGILAALVFAAQAHASTGGAPKSRPGTPPSPSGARACHERRCGVRSWLAFASALVAVAALGALVVEAHKVTRPGDEWHALTDGEDVVLTGYVIHDGLLRGSGAQRRQSIDLQVERIERAEPTHPSLREGWGTPQVRRRRKSERYGCVANAVYSAELLRAAGLPVCAAQTRTALGKAPHNQKNVVRGTQPVQRGGVEGAIGEKQIPRLRAERAQYAVAKAPAWHSAQDDSGGEDLGFTEQDASDGAVRRTFHPDGAVRISIYGRDLEDETSDGPDADDGVLPPVYTYGQRLRFTVKLRPPRNFGNPGAFDYAGYLRANGIHALGAARADRIQVLQGLGGSGYGVWRSRMRRSVLAQIHRLWRADEAGLLDAMLIGERSFIERDVQTAFQRTGIYHILVVSGMNVGILAFVIFWLLRRVRCGELAGTVFTIFLSCWHAYLAESGVPILRSVVMLAVFLCTRLIYRDRAMLNAIGAAALVLLVMDPAAVADSSFQLTFLSVLAIGGIAVPLLERTAQPLRRGVRWLGMAAYDMSLPPGLVQFRLDLRMLAARLALFLPRWPAAIRGTPNAVLRTRFAQRVLTSGIGAGLSVYEVLVVSAISQVALALPMAWYFHRATMVGLAANVVAVPLTGVLMPASVAAVALAYTWMPLARIPGLVASWSLAGITVTVHTLGGVRAADVRLARPTPLTCVVAAAAFVVALVLARKRHRWTAISLLVLVASAVWVVVVPVRPNVRSGLLEVTAIDVGQAESTLVVTPEGKTLLVDAAGPLGPWQSEFDYGQDVIAPYLWSRGITRLDAVAVTHAHSDHYGGMPSIISSFHPREMWVGPNAPDRGYESVLTLARAEGVETTQHWAGDRFSFGGAEVTVYSPPPGWQPGPRPKNDDSLVLRIAYQQTSALLEADAEKKSEEKMIAGLPPTDLLKVAHNGSKTSSTPEFLDALKPRYAVISVGARNSFGHPRREVLDRLAERHVLTYRTDALGAVTFYLDGRSVTPMLPNRSPL